MTGTISAPRVVPGAQDHRHEVPQDGLGPLGQTVPARLGTPVVAVHAVTLAVAFGFWAYIDRNLWFFGDEWDFLTRRGLHGATFSIWAPHNEHWSVLPILLWRGIFSLAHLSSYWPYLVPLLLAHVAVVHLLWRRCLREGADPWVANGLALLFALFGTGAEDLAWAFQIGFVGSLLLGLVAMELADGPRPGSRSWAPRPWLRDCLVSLVSLGALMCSDVGVATTVALAVVVLARYGWARLARTLALPVVSYVTWFALAGHTGLAATGDTLKASVFLELPRFVATNLRDDLGHAVGWPAAGALLAVVIMGWALWRSVALSRRHPAVLGGAVGAVAFYSLAALGRDRISASMAPSRYAYIGVALLLPTIALMLTALVGTVRRLPGHSSVAVPALRPREAGSPGLLVAVARSVVLAVVAAAIVANVAAGLDFVRSRTVFVRGLANQIITTAALLQNKQQMARSINVYPIWASGFASGYLTPWELANLARRDLVPRPGPRLMTEAQVRQDESWLDVSALHNRIYTGRFRLVARSGLVARERRGYVDGPGRLPVVEPRRYAAGRAATGVGRLGTWPPGPGGCTFSTPYGNATRSGSLSFAPLSGARGAALWVSLGASGGRVHFALGRAWGFRGPTGRTAVTGETVQVPGRGYLWVSDSVAGAGLVLDLSRGQRAEVCGLGA